MQRDVRAVASILEVACRATGARLALIARVTDQTWTAYSVWGESQHGLQVGDTLAAELTPCFEVKEQRRAVVFSQRLSG